MTSAITAAAVTAAAVTAAAIWLESGSIGCDDEVIGVDPGATLESAVRDRLLAGHRST